MNLVSALAVALTAQQGISVDPAPSWFLVILQGGSFAVLVYLLVVGLPKYQQSQDEARTREREDFGKHLNQQRNEFLAALAERSEKASTERRNERADYMTTIRDLTNTFRDESKAERSACEKHFATLADAMAKGNESTMEATRTIFQQMKNHSERNQQWLEVLRAELRKHDKVSADDGEER